MHKYIAHLLVIIAAVSAMSCEQDLDTYYDEVPRIYFAVDSAGYSFGDKPLNLQEHTHMIPLKIMGVPMSKDRIFKAEIIAEKTTSTEGVTHAAFTKEFKVLSDSVNAYLPVTILRPGIPTTDTISINFKIIDGGDFKRGVVESLETKLTFNNFLEKPSWWAWAQYYFGTYHPAKYQKFIELHGEAIDQEYMGQNFLQVLKVFKEVADFFKQNPMEGVEFPDVVWPV